MQFIISHDDQHFPVNAHSRLRLLVGLGVDLGVDRRSEGGCATGAFVGVGVETGVGTTAIGAGVEVGIGVGRSSSGVGAGVDAVATAGLFELLSLLAAAAGADDPLSVYMTSGIAIKPSNTIPAAEPAIV